MISGVMLRDGIISAANNIYNNREAVNALNVFPVPDGDTGTNMSMTMAAAKKAMEDITEEDGAGYVADKAASAMLRGARGNSGVILSLIFRGIADGLKGCDSSNGAIVATALELGATKAYKAVSKPTEGTILTVIKEAAISARKACVDNDADAAETFEAAYKGACDALAKTPDMLHVLKKARVVDAGGQGLCYIFAGLLGVFIDGVMTECEDTSEENAPNAVAFDGEVMSEDDIVFAYCSEFIVKKKENLKKNVSEMKKYFNKIGDCVVVVEDDDIIKVHIHSNEPGNVISKGLEYGELLTVKIENMKQQHRNARWGAAGEKAPSPIKEHLAPEKKYGFVAVSAGKGLEEMFSQLGVDKVVSGGQTMNPSTEDIVDAVNAVPAEIVYVLPNNKNIILASEQAVSLVNDKKIVIIESKTIPQGISALLVFDPDESETVNTENMSNAVGNVNTVSVTYAARDSFSGGLNIKKGQCMGIENGKITVVADDPNDAAYKTVRRIAKRSADIITIYYGESITKEKAEGLAEMLSAKYSGAEIMAVDGGQPVYHYFISVE